MEDTELFSLIVDLFKFFLGLALIAQIFFQSKKSKSNIKKVVIFFFFFQALSVCVKIGFSFIYRLTVNFKIKKKYPPPKKKTFSVKKMIEKKNTIFALRKKYFNFFSHSSYLTLASKNIPELQNNFQKYWRTQNYFVLLLIFLHFF